eukprot:1142087-Pelagomonas_calceolata.AAC.4
MEMAYPTRLSAQIVEPTSLQLHPWSAVSSCYCNPWAGKKAEFRVPASPMPSLSQVITKVRMGDAKHLSIAIWLLAHLTARYASSADAPMAEAPSDAAALLKVGSAELGLNSCGAKALLATRHMHREGTVNKVLPDHKSFMTMKHNLEAGLRAPRRRLHSSHGRATCAFANPTSPILLDACGHAECQP